MATPPDFSVGEVLTAAHMDAVGLWLVKTQVIGTTVSSVDVTSCFSSDYDNYYVTVSGGTTSTADDNIKLQMLSGSTASTTGYYGTAIYAVFGSTLTHQTDNNASQFTYAGGSDGRIILSLNVLSPNLAVPTAIGGPFIRQILAGTYSGIHRVNTAYDGFKVLATSGTFTGGTIRVYGYRN
jgi:hypothetical protein